MKMVRQMRMYCFLQAKYTAAPHPHLSGTAPATTPAPAGKDNSVPAENLDNKNPSLTLSGMKKT